jgi:hypothetical protein
VRGLKSGAEEASQLARGHLTHNTDKTKFKRWEKLHMSRGRFLVGSVLGAWGLMVGSILVMAQEPPPPGPGGPKSDMLNRGVAIRILDGGMEFNNKVVTGAPFSAQATTITDQTLADGNHIHHENQATLYRDSQGRTRREMTLGGLGPWSAAETETKMVVMINDPVAGVHYMLHPDERRAIQMPLPNTAIVKGMNAAKPLSAKAEAGNTAGGDKVYELPAPPPDAPGGDFHLFYRRFGEEEQTGQSESLGTQVIEGIKAEGTRITSTIPAGSIGNEQPIEIVTERWYSPELQMVMMSKRNDPRVGETTFRLSNINRVEPAAALFQVPTDYQVEKGPAPRLLQMQGPLTESKP